jgi:hypothetical protein
MSAIPVVEDDITERPRVTVVGRFDSRILVQCSWEPDGEYDAVSQATLRMLQQLGVQVVDESDNYLKPPVG